MPQVAAHFAIADLLSARLGANNPAYVASQPSAYKLGAIGPDLSFWLFDSLPARSLIMGALDVYFVIDDIKRLFGEISDRINGPLDDFADWVTGGLSTDFAALVERAALAARLAVEVTLLPGSTVTIANPFQGDSIPGIGNGATLTVTASDLSLALRAFGHPYSSDPPFKEAEDPSARYQRWWWMDLLHYRRVPLMAEELRAQAQDDLERAYVQGWFTHLAGDVAGHPYVNGVVGGPYRNHVIRHLVVEKIIDTWVHQHFRGGADIITAGLNQACDVGDDFARIAALLNRALEAIYVNPTGRAAGLPPIAPMHLGSNPPTPGQWQDGYDLMLRYLRLATDTGIAPPVPPPGSPAEFLAEVGSSIAGTAGNVAGSFSGSRSWWEWLLAPFLAALYALVLVFKLLTLPAAILTRVLTLAPRWLAFHLQLGLFNAIRELRWQLSLGGFGFPSVLDLTRDVAQASLRIPKIRTGQNAFNYPHLQVPRAQGFWLHDPAFFPTGPVPLEPNIASPRGVECSPYAETMLPDAFVRGRPTDLDPARLPLLQQMADALTSVAQTFENERATLMAVPPFAGTQLGSAVEFAEVLLDPNMKMLGAWDLDGDQGYGFLSWEGPPPAYFSAHDPSDKLTRR